MARPTKQGIDYFPVDVQFDEKIELLIAEFGAESLCVLMIIWQLTYQNNGYYVEAGKDLALLVKRRIMVPIDTTQEIIKACLSRGIFSQEKFEEHNILTSKAIQKRYFVAASKKKSVLVNRNYICSGVTVGDNAIYIVSENPTSSGVDYDGNATKEEVEVKEEEEVKVKGKEKSKYGVFKNVFLSSDEHEKLITKFNGQSQDRIDSLSEYLASSGKRYKSHYATILAWARKDGVGESNNMFAGGK